MDNQQDIMYNTECHSLLCDNLKKEFEKGYMYMYNWITLLYTWNYQNIVNKLYFITK